MVKEYQSLNPSNARIEIDYKKDKVHMEYVHHVSAFKTCFDLFLYPTLFINLMLLLIGVFIYAIIISEPTITKFMLEDIFSIENILTLIFVIWVIGTPFFLALLFSKNKRLLKKIPNLSYKLSSGNPIMAEFIPKDVVDNKVEIPLFENIGLDYEATGEFSKYLSSVKIIEHGFNDLIKGKKRLHPYLWKATFYFDKSPATGKLQVRFK